MSLRTSQATTTAVATVAGDINTSGIAACAAPLHVFTGATGAASAQANLVAGAAVEAGAAVVLVALEVHAGGVLRRETLAGRVAVGHLCVGAEALAIDAGGASGGAVVTAAATVELICLEVGADRLVVLDLARVGLLHGVAHAFAIAADLVLGAGTVAAAAVLDVLLYVDALHAAQLIALVGAPQALALALHALVHDVGQRSFAL